MTASIIYEASQCKSQMGSLVEKILSNKNIDSLAMNRGRRLGSSVLFKVSQMLRNKYGETEIKKSGLLLTKKYPLLGASPDGVTSRAVIEIKCPATVRTVSNYYVDQKIATKYRAQCNCKWFLLVKRSDTFV